MGEQKVAPGLDPDVRERVVTVEADTVHIEKMLHQASVHDFTFHSDEPASLEGNNKHPYPLDYFTAAIGM